MAVRSWDELRLLRLARRVFTVVKKKKKKVLHTQHRGSKRPRRTPHALTSGHGTRDARFETHDRNQNAVWFQPPPGTACRSISRFDLGQPQDTRSNFIHSREMIFSLSLSLSPRYDITHARLVCLGLGVGGCLLSRLPPLAPLARSCRCPPARCSGDGAALGPPAAPGAPAALLTPAATPGAPAALFSA